MDEVWRPVFGYEGLYEISNLGNLMRVSTYGGKPRRKPRAKAIKGGYRCFHLCSAGIRKYRPAHIMVWQSFVGPVPEGLEINHKDGDRDNPRLDNLEVVTRSENIKHSFAFLGKKTNFKPMPGEKNGCAKLTEDDVREIRALHVAGWRRIDIARKFNVTDVNIGHITSRRKWQHV